MIGNSHGRSSQLYIREWITAVVEHIIFSRIPQDANYVFYTPEKSGMSYRWINNFCEGKSTLCASATANNTTFNKCFLMNNNNHDTSTIITTSTNCTYSWGVCDNITTASTSLSNAHRSSIQQTEFSNISTAYHSGRPAPPYNKPISYIPIAVSHRNKLPYAISCPSTATSINFPQNASMFSSFLLFSSTTQDLLTSYFSDACKSASCGSITSSVPTNFTPTVLSFPSSSISSATSFESDLSSATISSVCNVFKNGLIPCPCLLNKANLRKLFSMQADDSAFSMDIFHIRTLTCHQIKNLLFEELNLSLTSSWSITINVFVRLHSPDSTTNLHTNNLSDPDSNVCKCEIYSNKKSNNQDIKLKHWYLLLEKWNINFDINTNIDTREGKKLLVNCSARRNLSMRMAISLRIIFSLCKILPTFSTIDTINNLSNTSNNDYLTYLTELNKKYHFMYGDINDNDICHCLPYIEIAISISSKYPPTVDRQSSFDYLYAHDAENGDGKYWFIISPLCSISTNRICVPCSSCNYDSSLFSNLSEQNGSFHSSSKEAVKLETKLGVISVNVHYNENAERNIPICPVFIHNRYSKHGISAKKNYEAYGHIKKSMKAKNEMHKKATSKLLKDEFKCENSNSSLLHVNVNFPTYMSQSPLRKNLFYKQQLSNIELYDIIDGPIWTSRSSTVNVFSENSLRDCNYNAIRNIWLDNEADDNLILNQRKITNDVSAFESNLFEFEGFIPWGQNCNLSHDYNKQIENQHNKKELDSQIHLRCKIEKGEYGTSEETYNCKMIQSTSIRNCEFQNFHDIDNEKIMDIKITEEALWNTLLEEESLIVYDKFDFYRSCNNINGTFYNRTNSNNNYIFNGSRCDVNNNYKSSDTTKEQCNTEYPMDSIESYIGFNWLEKKRNMETNDANTLRVLLQNSCDISEKDKDGMDIFIQEKIKNILAKLGRLSRELSSI